MKGVSSSPGASVPRQWSTHLQAACPELFPPFPREQGRLVTGHAQVALGVVTGSRV